MNPYDPPPQIPNPTAHLRKHANTQLFFGCFMVAIVPIIVVGSLALLIILFA